MLGPSGEGLRKGEIVSYLGNSFNNGAKPASIENVPLLLMILREGCIGAFTSILAQSGTS